MTYPFNVEALLQIDVNANSSDSARIKVDKVIEQIIEQLNGQLSLIPLRVEEDVGLSNFNSGSKEPRCEIDGDPLMVDGSCASCLQEEMLNKK